MDGGIIKFCKKFKEKLHNDEDIERDPDNKQDGDKTGLTGMFTDFRERITFSVNYKHHAPGYGMFSYPFGYNGENLFELDTEDLEYLYNKYSGKVDQEKEQRIAKAKKDIESEYE